MRLTQKRLSDYPWHVRLFFWLQKRKFGFVLNPNWLWGRRPKMMYAMALFYNSVEKNSSVPPVIRSLVTVYTSQINSCSFCIDMNSALLMERLEQSEKLDQLHQWQGSKLFTDQEKAALNYTEAMTYTDKEVSEQIYNQLKQYFNEDQILDLTALIAFQNLSSKFNNALDVKEQGFCRRL
ncbi:alkylhydroperoxidase [Piscirickettsia litoralis]|uniref:Alkylhydroperoxidase n=2 Tax=Piscirickettsia litoralis TaxID=1891921 RepID=A0ABX2ZYN6_9GAMM|nr:alkylhydroperoxidase [Piscirickettsia litoralis]